MNTPSAGLRSAVGSPAKLRRTRRVLHLLGWSTLGLFAAAVFVRVAIGWVFPIASHSMLPTVRDGEWVFLRWGRERPQLFDLVAFRTAGGDAVVKRVWALPDSRVLVEASGDVRVDGGFQDLPQRPASIVTYDQRVNGFDGYWNHGGSEIDPWRRIEPGASALGAANGLNQIWEVDSRAIEGRQDSVLLRFHKGVHNDRLEPDGTITYGTQTVNDVGLRAEVFVVQGGGSLRLELFEQGDRFEFELELPDASGEARGVLRRRPSPDSQDVVEASFFVPIGVWFPVAFSNMDDRMRAQVGDSKALIHAYRTNTAQPLEPGGDRPGQGQAPMPERVMLGADGAQVRFRSLVVERDIHVTPSGPFGVQRELRLGSDEVYVLGDNPANSRDSREMGPIPIERIIGRPLFVVWPPSAWRWLGR